MSKTGGKSKRAAIIYFPGRVDRKKLEAAIELTLSSLHWEPSLWLPTNPDETGGLQALRAVAQNATHLLVAGGDGTVRSVLQALAEEEITNVTVGIIPIGTGNALAKNLKQDISNLNVSVKRGLLGNRHPIDLVLAKVIRPNGEREEFYFSVMGGMGLDAKIMQNTNPKLKRAIGWVAYFEGGLRTLPTLFEKMWVSVDGREPRRLKLVSLLIGNAGWLPGNLSLMPDAKLDDGLLDVAAVGPRRFWNWLDLWGRVAFANQNVRPNRIGRQLMDASANVKTIENLTGSKIRVTPDRPVHLQLDGDVLGMVSEAEFEIVPRAITVRV
jgi:diacylglycerol kinase family enzyme